MWDNSCFTAAFNLKFNVFIPFIHLSHSLVFIICPTIFLTKIILTLLSLFTSSFFESLLTFLFQAKDNFPYFFSPFKKYITSFLVKCLCCMKAEPLKRSLSFCVCVCVLKAWVVCSNISGLYRGCRSNGVVLCCPTVPGAPPRKVEAEVINSTALRVTWKPPLTLKHHGQIRGYQLVYSRLEKGEPHGQPMIVDVSSPEAQVGTRDTITTTTRWCVHVIHWFHVVEDVRLNRNMAGGQRRYQKKQSPPNVCWSWNDVMKVWNLSRNIRGGGCLSWTLLMSRIYVWFCPFFSLNEGEGVTLRHKLGGLSPHLCVPSSLQPLQGPYKAPISLDSPQVALIVSLSCFCFRLTWFAVWAAFLSYLWSRTCLRRHIFPLLFINPFTSLLNSLLSSYISDDWSFCSWAHHNNEPLAVSMAMKLVCS